MSRNNPILYTFKNIPIKYFSEIYFGLIERLIMVEGRERL